MWMSLAATAVSTVMQLASSEEQPQEDFETAEANAQLAESRANQLDQNAGQEQAGAQRKAREERYRGRIAASKAQAAGAAGGAGAFGFVGFEDNIADLQARSEFNALSHLFEGDSAARALHNDADMERYNASRLRRGGALAYNASVDREKARKQKALLSGLSSAASIGSKLAGPATPSAGGSRIPTISTDARGPR